MVAFNIKWSKLTKKIIKNTADAAKTEDNEYHLYNNFKIVLTCFIVLLNIYCIIKMFLNKLRKTYCELLILISLKSQNLAYKSYKYYTTFISSFKNIQIQVFIISLK